jgi:hypothetical protein
LRLEVPEGLGAETQAFVALEVVEGGGSLTADRRLEVAVALHRRLAM